MGSYNEANLVSAEDIVGIVKAGEIGHKSEIDIKGNYRVKTAIREFSKYGLITFSREQYFKSTYYYINFIKPVKKLKQLYNLGDELLILCCHDSLNKFKSRTKDFIDYLLATNAEYKNRLDKVTCFLLDNCDNIENLILADRIENPDARLIVPFSYSEIENGLDDEKLQNRLRSFLYERDLFGIASPLNSDNLFFGRDRTNIISEIYGKYRQGEHGGLFGLRRIGKTSILNLLRLRVERDNGVAIYFDCSKFHHQRWNLFLYQIVQEIIEKYKNDTQEPDTLHLSPDFYLADTELRYVEAKATLSFEADLTAIYKNLNKTRILLIFDEIEQISYTTSPSEHWKSGNDAFFFWQVIRSISQTNNELLSYVITGVNPKCIEIAKINGNPNPIFNGLTPQFISLFDLDDIKNMVSSIGGHLGIRFEEEIYTKLIDDYGGHPFMTRQVCSRMNSELLERHEARPFKISKYNYEKHAKEYQSKMVGVIEQILGVLQDYYPEEYEALKVLALNGVAAFRKQIGFNENSIAHLLGYCLIAKENDEYFIQIKSIQEYINNQHCYEKTLTTQPEKRARIQERRSNIEEKLRNIIFVNLKTKYGSKAKERFMLYIQNTSTDPTREKAMQKSNLKDALTEANFSQLKAIILKDWKDYQTLFCDRVKFEQFFDVINTFRVDAHTKEISEEDEALITIAFKYFEKALAD